MKRLSNPSLRGAARRGNLTRTITIFVFMTLFILLTATLAHAKVIRDDATGGDCTTFGTWDTSTKTCTMTSDLKEGIQIRNNSITLDGNKHKIDGQGSGMGVSVGLKNGIVIKNLQINNFYSGIQASSNVYDDYKILNNTISNSQYGIWFSGADNHLVEGNKLLNNRYGMFIRTYEPYLFYDEPGSFILKNIFQLNEIGLEIFGSEFITLRNNTFNQNVIGLELDNIADITVVNNNFIDNTYQVYENMGWIDVLFNLDKPIGGNYWSNWTSPDNNGDGFVDEPLLLGVDYWDTSRLIYDNFPWTTPNGWLNHPT